MVSQPMFLYERLSVVCAWSKPSVKNDSSSSNRSESAPAPRPAESELLKAPAEPEQCDNATQRPRQTKPRYVF